MISDKKIVLSLMLLVSSCCQASIYLNPKNYTGSYVPSAGSGAVIFTASSPVINQIIQNSGVVPPPTPTWSLNTSKGRGGYQAFVCPEGSMSNPAIKACVIDPSNKIVIVGNVSVPPKKFLAVRLTANGMIDSTFNHTGSLVFNPTDFTAALTSVINGPSGSYYVAGYSGSFGYISAITSTGQVDSRFGHGTGYYTNTNVAIIVGIATQKLSSNAGKIVYAGDPGSSNFYVGRISALGIPDSSPLYRSTSGEMTPSGIAVDALDRIIVVGNAAGNGKVYRINPNGGIDTTFGSSGFQQIPSSNIYAVVILSDNSIIAVGDDNGSPKSVKVIKLTSTGAFDSSFGDGGIVTAQGLPFDNSGNAVTLLPDGGIAVTGYVQDSENSFATMLLNSNGSFNTTFSIPGETTAGAEGVAFVQPGGSGSTAYGIGYQTTAGSAGLVVVGTTIVPVSSVSGLGAVFYLNS